MVVPLPPTRAIAAHVTGRPARLVEEAVLLSAILDTVGVAIASGSEPAVATLQRTLGAQRGGMEGGPCTLWSDGSRAGALDAALVNGTAGHALDYDDVFDVMRGHPSTVIVPALVAVGELVSSAGDELLVAQAVALEVVAALAGLLDVQSHYMQGWHATATLGRIAATAGCCRLLGLGADATARAVGMASSMASGIRANFGTMTKPLHAGLAARDAVLASLLARDAFTATETGIEGPNGLMQVLGLDLDRRRSEEFEAVLGAQVDLGTNIKRFPCCYNTHRAVDAALDVRSLIGDTDSIERIEVQVELTGMAALRPGPAVTGLQGKFSMEYCVAAALLDGQLCLASFSDEAVARPNARSLAQRIIVTEGAVPFLGPAAVGAEYACIRGFDEDENVLFERRVDVPLGHADRPMSKDELNGKFDDCVRWTFPDVDPDVLRGLWWSVGELGPSAVGDAHRIALGG